MKAKLDEATATLARVCAPPPACTVIAKHNGRKKKAHDALVDGKDAPPQMWRTRCGRPFADWVFTRHADISEFPEDYICRACFPGRPDERLAGVAAAAERDAAQLSSSGDSSSDTEDPDHDTDESD